MTVFRQIMIIYSIWVSVVPWLQTLCKPEKIFLYTRLINSIFLFSSELFVGRHENISILFADICKFTELTTTLSVDKLVETLNDLFGKFDDAADVSISQYTEWFVKKLHSNILHYVRWCYTLNFCKGNGKLIFQYSNNTGPTLLHITKLHSLVSY